MTTDVITSLLKSGYAPFKDAAAVAEWVLPARSLDEVVGELGDKAILEMTGPLRLAPDLETQLPEPVTASCEDFRRSAVGWAPLSKVKPVVEACLDAQASLAMSRTNQLKDSAGICRALSVLAAAAFIPGGELVLTDLASILGGCQDKPGELIGRYVHAVLADDSASVRQVSTCLNRHQEWVKWSALFVGKALAMKANPRLVAVTPPVSADIVWVLAQMLKEGYADDSRGDHSDCPAG